MKWQLPPLWFKYERGLSRVLLVDSTRYPQLKSPDDMIRER
jgi:hypothetical protein